jgi:hypothetical protein
MSFELENASYDQLLRVLDVLDKIAKDHTALSAWYEWATGDEEYFSNWIDFEASLKSWEVR